MRKTCIIAEHDPWDIRLLRMYVERLGLRLVTAFDGQDLLRLARAERPDVIILESDLPGSPEAGSVLDALKLQDDTHDIPVVLFSWFDRALTGATDASADSHLRKPASFEAFEAALTQAGVLGQEDHSPDAITNSQFSAFHYRGGTS